MTFHWRDWVPKGLKDLKKRWKKKRFNAQMERWVVSGKVWTANDLSVHLSDAGITLGDQVMVHASMSKMGVLEKGPESFIDALKEVIGSSGAILMPTSPIPTLQFDYVQSNPVFDVRNTPSAMGAISEVFRKFPEVHRSLHPTEPVAAWGVDAYEYIKDHTVKNTPYHGDSPYGKLIQNGGKILYIGVTLDNAGTHLHTLEDAIDVGVPVYYPQEFKLPVIDYDGKEIIITTKVHNPEYSKKRRCDELLPMFLQEGVYREVQIGKAKTLVFDAKKMFDVMVGAFNERGVTMYNPEGTR
jgi:aminoglycoside 3-N-acetyltransferase